MFVCLVLFCLLFLFSLFPVSTIFQILMCFHIYRNFLPQFVPCQCHRSQLLLDGHHHKPLRGERASQTLAAGACVVRSDSLLREGHSPSVSLGPRGRWLSTAWLVTEHVYGRRCWRLWRGPCSVLLASLLSALVAHELRRWSPVCQGLHQIPKEILAVAFQGSGIETSDEGIAVIVSPSPKPSRAHCCE